MHLPRADEYKGKWTLLLTRASFEAVENPTCMNHFLSCWEAGSVTAWEEAARVQDRAKHVRLQLLAKMSEATQMA